MISDGEEEVSTLPTSHFEGYGGVTDSTSLSSSTVDASDSESSDVSLSGASGAGESSTLTGEARTPAHDASDPEALRSRLMTLRPPPAPHSVLRQIVSVGVPFLGLSITYSLWFVTQKVFNNEYRTNVFGYVLSEL